MTRFLILRICLAASAMAFVGPALAIGADEIGADNVVILLDASGSMGEALRGTARSRMDAAKSGLRAALERMPESTRVGLLVLSSSNLRSAWVHPLGEQNRAALRRAVDLPLPGGATPLGRFLKTAADALLAQRERQLGYGTFRLLVVTDGQADDAELMERHAREAVARGIRLDVIGVAMTERHALASVAHAYWHANDAAGLERAMRVGLAEVGTAASDDIAADAFDLLASLPNGAPAAMLRALEPNGNQPLGEAPPKPAIVEAQTPAAQSEAHPVVNPVNQSAVLPAHVSTLAATAGLYVIGCGVLVLIVIALLMGGRR